MAGIYIHIPFCKQACTYCNFHFSTNLNQSSEFLVALKKEISISSDFISHSEVIDTIYFGGGTPSLLRFEEILSILDELQKKYSIAHDAEITIEANPDDIQYSTIKAWMNLGINRISLGIQTFSDEELQFMNRTHSSDQSLISIKEIQDAGITNFSIDLIFGSQMQTDQELIKNIEMVTKNKIPHVSCYALTAEPKTLLHH